ncbi:M24 family metallopeptidase [Enterococcus casseliflavus]|uniref:M24 family metallopeptidase n=1 Tax=Enterococcus casseliflavus TaxID=37734 RepID=UPI001E2CD161|nr:M24 family metallopeptidase [Enterococcus casseliflavus]MCD4962555.1 M24 family metallopeptidase [Enterococcus casseliflavus]
MITLQSIPKPNLEENLSPVMLTDETIIERKQRLLKKMEEAHYDTLFIYADLEHGGNFEYLMGFVPRFEEAILILHSDGSAYAVLGNENLNKANKARIEVTAVHMPHLSLPNQPMSTGETVAEILAKCELANKENIGIIGWKNFTHTTDDVRTLFDIPHFLLEALKQASKKSHLTNATSIMIGAGGVRTTNNANEFAHYEFGSALAGKCMLEAMDEIAVGKTEMNIAESLSAQGQPHNVVTIMASGKRFEKANLYPTAKKVVLGDPISMTTGFKGGLESRVGYAVNQAKELPEMQQDYLEKVAIPYFTAFKTWIEQAKIGMSGKDMYDLINTVFPKNTYGWSLNPGHLCGDEEWLGSPIYPESEEILQSGMLFQVDIIPSVNGYAGASCESGVFLADPQLRNEIQHTYPTIWQRILQRKSYLRDTLGIELSEEVLPMSAITGYFRPFLLNKNTGLANK